MARRIRIGLIGAGKHGSRYGNHLVRDLADCFELALVCRRSEEGRQQAADWGAGYCRDYRELIADPAVEAVVSVVTPNLNEEIGRLCVEAGKPLLLEKPLTTDYYSARRIVEQFARRQVGLTIAQTLRYNTVIRGLRAHRRTMGRLYSLSASQRLEPSHLGWLEDPDIAGSGVIFHTGVHLFDALRYICDEEIVAVRASGASIHNPRLEDLLVAELRFAGGGIGMIDTSKVARARCGRYELVCENGQLQGDQIHGMLERIDNMTITSLDVEPVGPTLVPLLSDWHRFLVGDGDNPIPGEAGLAAVKICHACREAMQKGGWVELASL